MTHPCGMRPIQDTWVRRAILPRSFQYRVHHGPDGSRDANFSEPDPEFRDLRITGVHRDRSRDHFYWSSYGIGGQCSSVIMEVL